MNLVIFIPAASERFSDQTLCNWVLVAPSSARQGNAQLSQLRADIAQPIDNITVCLEAGRVLYVETPLPSVSTAKRNALLRYAIEDKLSADPTAIHAVIVGKSSYQTGQTIVAAIDGNWLSAMLATLRACNLSPHVVIDMPQALRLINADKLNAAPKIGVNMAAGAGFAVRDDGYALSFDGASTTNPPFALVLALQEFAQQRPGNADSTAVFNLIGLSPSNDSINGVDFAHWATATNQTLNDAGALSMRALAQALVDAQRTNRKPALPQMLSGSHAPASQLGGQFRLFKPAMLLAGLALVAHIAYLAWDNWRLSTARDAAQSRMVSLFQKTFPDAKAIVDPALQMQRSLNTLKGAAVNTPSTPPFAVALSEAAAILGTQNSSAQVLAVTGTATQIKVDASVTTLDLANAVRTRLAANNAGATITVAAAADGKSQQLQLTVPFKNAAPQGAKTP